MRISFQVVLNPVLEFTVKLLHRPSLVKVNQQLLCFLRDVCTLISILILLLRIVQVLRLLLLGTFVLVSPVTRTTLICGILTLVYIGVVLLIRPFAFTLGFVFGFRSRQLYVLRTLRCLDDAL
jgi:hypothetical protein